VQIPLKVIPCWYIFNGVSAALALMSKDGRGLRCALFGYVLQAKIRASAARNLLEPRAT
jgi:hypothetical protein